MFDQTPVNRINGIQWKRAASQAEGENGGGEGPSTALRCH